MVADNPMQNRDSVWNKLIKSISYRINLKFDAENMIKN